MKNITFLFVFACLFTTSAFSQITYVPDDNFEQALIDLGYDSGIPDNFVPTNNINTIPFLYIDNKNIADLTGIEDFVALTILYCSNNLLTNLDVSQNIALTELYCDSNQLTSIDLSQNTALTKLDCNSNQLTNIDVSQHTDLTNLNCGQNPLTNLDVSQNTALIRLSCDQNSLTNLDVSQNIALAYLNCGQNPLTILDVIQNTALTNLSCDQNSLTSLDVSQNTALTSLSCSQNSLTSLDVSQNVALTNLSCHQNSLTSLDLSQNIALTHLRCFSNQLISLDMSQNVALATLHCYSNLLTNLDVSQNTALTYLNCGDNSLTSLDVSQNITLTQLHCYSNQLANLDVTQNTVLESLRCFSNSLTNFNVKNGNNTNITLFVASSNPNLLCIEVDDATWSTANWLIVDPQASFSEVDCALGNYVTYVPDDNFEQALIDLGYDTGILDDYVPTVILNSITSLDINSKSIADLTGIEDFTALTYLRCSNNNLTSINISNNTALTSLYCDSNQITNLDISQNLALNILVCNNNILTSIDVSNNTSLTSLYCYSNQLTNLNVTQNTALTQLRCYSNQLTNLDVTQNIALTGLYCYSNQLTNLDVTQNTALTWLVLHSNQLTSLDVSQNTALARLDCYSNQLTSLDVTQNTVLYRLICSNNQLTSLDVKNGNNTNITSFNSTNNPDLICINVDDALYSTTNWTNVDPTSSFSDDCSNFFCTVNIPDTIFKNLLLNRTDINTNGDNEIQCSEAAAYTGTLSFNNKNINDLTGIEAFTALTKLYCNHNNLTNLDLSQNIALTEISCYNNNLITLNVTQITSLVTLVCYTNNLANIDISNNIALTTLSCYSNQLTSLDFSQNTVLTAIFCNNNLLTSLDVSQNTVLSRLGCSSNQLTSLDVSSNIALTEIYCNDTLLTSLDLSQNTALSYLEFNNNNLTSLNIKNGNNAAIPSYAFNTTNNPNLTCIEVDDAVWSTTNWTNIDPQTNFSENCHYGETYVPDDNFEQALIDLGYDTFLDDYVTTTNINTITFLNVNNKSITDLTGIESFIALTYLSCNNNVLTSIDVSQNVALSNLQCYSNQLSSLDITQNTALTKIFCQDNLITSLDVSQNSSLTNLTCYNNQLTSLDVSQNTALTLLSCYTNLLSSLDISQNTALVSLHCYSNQITNLDVSQNTSLTGLFCNDNLLTNLDVSQNTALSSLYCYSNQLSNLDVSQNTSLTNLFCYSNQITDLDVSQNTSLSKFDCSSNQLTSLNVKNGNNTNFASFNATNNPNLICIEVDDAAWSSTNWTNIDVTASFSENCNPCIVNIPDATFKSLLVGDAAINTNGDSEIQCDEASAYTGNIQVSYWSISDLTGIEAFTSLTELYCNNNNITSLDLSQNTALTILNTSANPINTLDVTNNTALTTLYCSSNLLNTLDVSQNTYLYDVDCNDNSLTTLNLSQNTDLEILKCYDNQLTSLDLTLNTFLFDLDCDNNLLSSLDLNLNTDLGSLVCSNNSLNTLDLSQNTFLDFLICTYNTPLTSLNVANGNNINFSYFRADNNPNLTCIEVDDAVWSTNNWTNIDPQTSFSEDCGTKIWENGAWTNGAPSISDIAIIRDNYSTTTQTANIEANSLLIDLGYTLTIESGDYLKVENNLTINGNLIIQHEGSFVQINDLATVTNNGNIQVLKDMTSFDAGTDFAILGSPMTGETRDGVFIQNNVTMNHLTNNFTPNNDVALADPLAENFADDDGNNWQFFIASEVIVPGTGYLVGGITGGGAFTSNYTQGTLNNGIIDFPVIYNGSQNASPNILSNPYASAIDANIFINNNSIVDAIYFWEHLTPPSNTYPGYRSENWDMGDISMYNLSGGIASANGGSAPTQFIPSGQGFAIKANAVGTVSFSNSIRVTGNNTGYRNTENTNRMYVNISNETYGLKSKTLIAFTPEATDGIDASYDAKRLATPISIYSIAEAQELAIQGRSTFNEDQVIPFGFRTQVEELQEYTISLGLIEGTEITNAIIYLQDNLLQTVTNLSETIYSFTSEEGNFSNRFLIYFREESLGVGELNANTVTLHPNPVSNQLTISSISSISKISILDISGRVIRIINANGSTILTVDLSLLSSATYFIKVQNQKGSLTKRVIKK